MIIFNGCQKSSQKELDVNPYMRMNCQIGGGGYDLNNGMAKMSGHVDYYQWVVFSFEPYSGNRYLVYNHTEDPLHQNPMIGEYNPRVDSLTIWNPGKESAINFIQVRLLRTDEEAIASGFFVLKGRMLGYAIFHREWAGYGGQGLGGLSDYKVPVTLE